MAAARHHPGRLLFLPFNRYAVTAGSANVRENDRTMNPPTATAELSRITRRYCAAGRLLSPNTVRNSPKLALQAQSVK